MLTIEGGPQEDAYESLRFMFADESRFSDNLKRRVRNVHEVHRYGRGIRVRASIKNNGKTPLYILKQVPLHQWCSSIEILLRHIRLFQVAADSDFLFMDAF
ncbi:hypothetical protein TNCV_1620891 [Trichonephila clavipes]|nr:hypothetical protein TNCV_1620891 [Trichonephila clavipes]